MSRRRPPPRRSGRPGPSSKSASPKVASSSSAGPREPVLTAACVWLMSPELLAAVEEQFGSPVDTYVNGSQVWIRDDGPADMALEWRLHPVAGYRRPKGVTTEDLFDAMTAALVGQAPSPAPLEEVWEGLECFAAFGDNIGATALAAAATRALGRAPDGAGMVDHEAIADHWEQSNRASSIVGVLLQQIRGAPPTAPS